MYCVSAALSMTKPSSVLSFAERGSKLYDPTNTRVPSTANVFACRLEPELPSRPAWCSPRSAAPMTADVRRNSKSATPASSSALRRFE